MLVVAWYGAQHCCAHVHVLTYMYSVLIFQLCSPGSMRELHVIDVARQDDTKMTMREWTEYYEMVKKRKKILNVISLEFSDTEYVKSLFLWT